MQQPLFSRVSTVDAVTDFRRAFARGSTSARRLAAFALPRATVRRPRVPATAMASSTTTPAILRKLQNGSDVRGVALEGVEGEPVTLTEQAAYLIGASFIDWLVTKTGKPAADLTVAVGRDPRLSGPALANAMFAGFASKGCGGIVDMGLATTPACFMSTVTPTTDYDAGIMLTASHLPFNRNGAKFFTAAGGLDKGDISRHLRRSRRRVRSHPRGR